MPEYQEFRKPPSESVPDWLSRQSGTGWKFLSFTAGTHYAIFTREHQTSGRYIADGESVAFIAWLGFTILATIALIATLIVSIVMLAWYPIFVILNIALLSYCLALWLNGLEKIKECP